MKIPWKKVLTVAVPVGIAMGAFYWWYKSQQRKPMTVTASPATTPPVKISPSVATGAFPLKQGSTGNAVRQLQTALGADVDGNFGPQTLTALQSMFAMNSVPDQNTLSAIIKVAADPVGATAAGWAIFNTWQQGGVDVYINTDTFAAMVDGTTLIQNGQGFQMNAKQTYDNATYNLNRGVAPLGQLYFTATTGPLQGVYIIDPSAISLVVHIGAAATYNPIPTTDPNSGLTNF